MISNHVFVDYNKPFLQANGIKIECTNEDIVKIGLGVVSDKMTYDELLE